MGAGASVSAFPGREEFIKCLLDVTTSSINELTKVYHYIGADIAHVLPELIEQHPVFLLTLTTMLAAVRNKSVSSVVLQAISSSCGVNISDSYPMNTLDLDVPIDQAKTAIKIFMESHRLNTACAINAECDEMTSLDNLAPYLKNKQFMLSSLNIANSQLPADSLHSCAIQRSECLLQLHIGGNSFTSMNEIVPYMPTSLLILDVSFTDGLQFTPGVFLTCPQLLHLCIDGCGITTTAFASTDTDNTSSTSALTRECSKSIFFGLVSLVNLSMKENQLETAESLHGLQYFSLCSDAVAGETVGSVGSGSAESTACLPTLRNICIADNPMCETSAEHKAAITFISTHIPSVRTIDDKTITTNNTNTTCVDRSSTAFLKQHALDKALRENEKGMNVVSDAMEREFQSAMMGEKDNAVVS